MDYQEVDLQTINKGAIGELFDEELGKVIANIQDQNTDPKAVRKITIEVRVKPNEARDRADTTVQVKSSLAPIKPHDHYVVFSRRGGKIGALTTDPQEQPLPFEGQENITEFTGGN